MVLYVIPISVSIPDLLFSALRVDTSPLLAMNTHSAKFWQGGFDVLSRMVDELEKL
jgi:hypothetical protein